MSNRKKEASTGTCTHSPNRRLGFAGRGMLTLIRFYQRYISPQIAARCRYLPTCSQYAVEAIEAYGFFVGTAKSIWRVLRCNPWSKGGYDPAVKQNLKE